jgi:hypothetical protein
MKIIPSMLLQYPLYLEFLNNASKTFGSAKPPKPKSEGVDEEKQTVISVGL